MSYWAVTGLVLALLAGLAGALAGFGSRWGWWAFQTGFGLLKWAVIGGLVAVAVSFVGAILARPTGPRHGFWLAVLGLLIGLVVVGVPVRWLKTARSVPPIHDITTDLEHPPAFVAILPIRAEAPNPTEYGGPEVAAQQRTGYPDLGPARLDLPPAQAFEQALAAARGMGWEVVAVDAADGRIEATDTTFWFGFKDDVVVRVAPADGGSRIDVRSVSRVGRSDVGTNAKRIHAYLDRVKNTQ